MMSPCCIRASRQKPLSKTHILHDSVKSVGAILLAITGHIPFNANILAFRFVDSIP
ncbi:hypothetical protein EI77_00496 [Prosthecobacter fusiformis]|uniref:Uncharacterized protein n=1 Tax=Prosthecobacter fusiformis TaxID=48464 RepID=A0A4V3FI63_9BACT|nr:hypothetical protein EI77_00496 [Prosthecobacter fusiformis]